MRRNTIPKISNKVLFKKIQPRRLDLFVCVIVFSILLYVNGFLMNFIEAEILIDNILVSGINYDAYRDIYISEEILTKAQYKIDKIIKKYPELATCSYVDSIGLITFSMLAAEYNLIDYGIINEKLFLKGIGQLAATDSFQELYGYNKAILSDLIYFPVPMVTSGEADISYADSWFKTRHYGGIRRHEGTDLMASNNIRGYFPVISITDGVVENIGWLEKGGDRVGIRSTSGCYFYYAHLSSYAPDLNEGDTVIAGQLLGFMGDSGYGPEGTIGQFDVHLHLGIYVDSVFGELSVNPYWILKMLEDNRIAVTIQSGS